MREMEDHTSCGSRLHTYKEVGSSESLRSWKTSKVSTDKAQSFSKKVSSRATSEPSRDFKGHCSGEWVSKH